MLLISEQICCQLRRSWTRIVKFFYEELGIHPRSSWMCQDDSRSRWGPILSSRKSPACTTSVTMTCDIFSNWHRRFGHLNFKDLEVMMKENLVAGAKLKGAVSTNNPCKICIAGKFATAPFPRRPNRSSNLLDIVHTDVCGPMRIESKGGARYFVTFTDDYSRWTQTYLIRKKPK
jgi:hypothetical protein